MEAMQYTSCKKELVMSRPRLTTEHALVQEDRFRILFNITCKRKSRYTWILEDADHQSPMEEESESPCVSKLLRFEIRKTSMDSLKMSEKMIELLVDFPLKPVERVELAYKAADTAYDLLDTCMPDGHNQLNLHLDFTAIFHGVRDHNLVGDHHHATDHNMLINGSNLEGKKPADSCAICLEDFQGQLLWLPCCHYFHRCCIVRWLTRSRCCPICRFEITSTN